MTLSEFISALHRSRKEIAESYAETEHRHIRQGGEPRFAGEAIVEGQITIVAEGYPLITIRCKDYPK